jgi:hypothetical protein
VHNRVEQICKEIFAECEKPLLYQCSGVIYMSMSSANAKYLENT